MSGTDFVSVCPPRPQPPALPHQRCGGHTLPDGGGHRGHDLPTGLAHGPGDGTVFSWNHRRSARQSHPQLAHNRDLQWAVAMETLSQLCSAAHVGV